MASGGELVLVPHLPTMLALIAFFVLLVVPMNRLIFKPIFATLDARGDRIAGPRARAAKLAEEAEAKNLQAGVGLVHFPRMLGLLRSPAHG